MKVPQTLADMLDNNAWKYPDETAFVWGDRRVSRLRSFTCPRVNARPVRFGDWD